MKKNNYALAKAKINKIVREEINHDSDIDYEECIINFLNSFSQKEKQEMWVDYDQLMVPANYENPLSILMFNKLDESMTRIFPIDKTISYISKCFNLHPGQISKAKADNGVEHIIVIIPHIHNNLEEVKRAMNLCGFFLSTAENSIPPAGRFIKLRFEPTFQKNETESIRKSEQYLYHLTPQNNLTKIQNIGFSPRGKNEMFNYPNRVYFLRGSIDEQNILFIGQQLFQKNNNLGNNGDYVLIKIDLTKVPEDIDFFLDPNYPYGIYTAQNISKDVIVGTKPIKFKR